LLLNTSADAVICSFDFSPLVGRMCHLDTTGMGTESTGYVTYRIRRQMITQGVQLTDVRGDAEVIVEVGLAAYGTDYQKKEFGIFEANSIPEIQLCERSTQYGVAKLSMFAWEPKSGQVIWQTPTMRADSHQITKDVLGTGPFYSGTIEHSANRINRHQSKVAR
jgi:hypothetical protein